MNKGETQVNHMKPASIQIMDITSLKAVISEIRKKIVPSRFEKAQQPDAHTLQMGLRTLTGLTWIEICWHADAPRLVEIESPTKIKGESTLSKQIKFGLKDMALIELKQEGFERVVEFGFAFRPNEKNIKSLIIEIMGRHSNLLFLNKDRQIITLGKQVRENQSRLRPISTGDIYTLPPRLHGEKPTADLSFEAWKQKLMLLPISLKKALSSTFQGISPALSLQLVSEDKKSAEEILDLQVNELANKDWVYIFKRWNKWIRDIESENFCIDFDGPTPYRVWEPNISNLVSRNEISISLGKYYKKNVNYKKITQRYNTLSKDICERKLAEENCLKKQELLYSKLSEAIYLKEKADNMLCINAPNKKQVQEAQKLYIKAKKIRRSKKFLLERINYHKANINFLNEADLFLNYIIEDYKANQDLTIEHLYNIKDDLASFLLGKKLRSKKQYRQTEAKSEILTIKSPSGLKVKIGRNHRQNELISIKQSKKGDLWFHAQECAGSHIVIKGSHGEIDDYDIKLGADLAAFFSKAKNNNKVSVLMAQTTNLQRLKGATVGTVSPRNAKVLWGNPTEGQQYLEQTTNNA